MPRKTHILYKDATDKLDGEIARLMTRRSALVAESTVDIDVILSELRNVKRFNYQYSHIWFAVTPAMEATLPRFIGGQEEYVVPLEMGVSMHIEQGNHIGLSHSSKDPNSILPFLKKHGVQRSAIDYSNKVHRRDEAAKKLREEQAEVDAIEAALKETYAS